MTEILEIILYSTSTIIGILIHNYYLRKTIESERAEERLLLLGEDLDRDLDLNEDDYLLMPEHISENLKCSITLDVMRDPLICKYGFCYEKQGIIDWVKKNKSCPSNRSYLDLTDLRPNIALKNAIKLEILKEKYKRILNL